VSGLLALVGGGEWSEGCDFDRELLEASGADEVLLLPTAAAFQNPSRCVEQATAWFDGLGARVRALPVYGRQDANDAAHADAVRSARFVYLAGGSPLHLRSVLKETPLWEAVLEAWEQGAVVAGAGDAAGALCEPLVDPRGGALTVGLGLVVNLAVVPHARADLDTDPDHKRTLALAKGGVALAAVPDRTALIREPDGRWRTSGQGAVRVFVDGAETGLDALP
jgi:cyanophycinase